MGKCTSCNKTLAKNSMYCSNKCQALRLHIDYIDKWKAGLVTGERGINTKNISAHLVRYLKSKYNDKCSLCGWHRVNENTGRVPLEIDHLDGDASNNTESNLRLICPNCYALTCNYKNSNKGSGRDWRRTKYIKN